MPRFLTDLVERVIATYATAFLGLLLANGFDLTDLGAVKAAAIASIPAALSIIKGVLARFVGDPGTAALLPTAPVIRR
jgi:hypothetical protein